MYNDARLTTLSCNTSDKKKKKGLSYGAQVAIFLRTFERLRASQTRCIKSGFHGVGSVHTQISFYAPCCSQCPGWCKVIFAFQLALPASALGSPPTPFSFVLQICHNPDVWYLLLPFIAWFLVHPPPLQVLQQDQMVPKNNGKWHMKYLRNPCHRLFCTHTAHF